MNNCIFYDEYQCHPATIPFCLIKGDGSTRPAQNLNCYNNYLCPYFVNKYDAEDIARCKRCAGRGKWEPIYFHNEIGAYSCGNCGCVVPSCRQKLKFCPECGTDMREVQE